MLQAFLSPTPAEGRANQFNWFPECPLAKSKGEREEEFTDEKEVEELGLSEFLIHSLPSIATKSFWSLTPLTAIQQR